MPGLPQHRPETPKSGAGGCWRGDQQAAEESGTRLGSPALPKQPAHQSRSVRRGRNERRRPLRGRGTGQRDKGRTAAGESQGQRLPPTAPVPLALTTTGTARVSTPRPGGALGAAPIWPVGGGSGEGHVALHRISCGPYVALRAVAKPNHPLGSCCPPPPSGKEKAGRTTKGREGAAQKQDDDQEWPRGPQPEGARPDGGQASETPPPVQRTQRLVSDGVSASRVPLTPPTGLAGVPPPREPPQATPWGPASPRTAGTSCPFVPSWGVRSLRRSDQERAGLGAVHRENGGNQTQRGAERPRDRGQVGTLRFTRSDAACRHTPAVAVLGARDTSH